MYEGYTATAPFSGVITTPQGVLRIGVLDNTGGEFIIYEGTPSSAAHRHWVASCAVGSSSALPT